MKLSPFTADEVGSINGYQADPRFHPFTCGRGACDGVLTATPDGLRCTNEGCPYEQHWVHPFMADGSWRRLAPTM